MSLIRRIRWWAMAVSIVAVLAGGAIALTDRTKSKSAATAPAAPAEPKVVMVTAEPVTLRPVQRRVQVVGSLWGRDEVAITPKVEGRVEKIRAFVGDIVKPGDVLMEIEEKDYHLAVNEARRSLELELAKLNLTQLPPADFDVDKLPSVARSIAQEKLALANRERLKRLVGAARVTEEERDKFEAEVSVAQANTQQMRLEAQTALAQVRHKVAVLETAQQKLDNTKLIVPYQSGQATLQAAYVVGQRNVSEGETVGTLISSTPVFRLVIADPLKLIATIPERYIAEVKVGQTVEIQVEAYDNESFPAKVDRVNPTVDRASRTFQAEILVGNAQRRLHAGSFAKGAILTRMDDKAIIVPDEALVTFAGVTKVFVLRDGKAFEVPVSAGVRFEDDSAGRRRFCIEVTGKLKSGDQVVTSGHSQLADGTPAKVRPSSVK